MSRAALPAVLPEDERLCRDLRQLFLDQGGAPVAAAHRAPSCAGSRAACRRVGDRGDFDLLADRARHWPPTPRTRRPRGDQQSAMAALDGAELVGELVVESLGGEIGGAIVSSPQ